MRKAILISFILLLTSCKQEESKLQKDSDAAKSKLSQAIEESKKVAEDIAVRAEEEAEAAAEAIEDAAVDIKEQAVEVEQDLKDALAD